MAKKLSVKEQRRRQAQREVYHVGADGELLKFKRVKNGYKVEEVPTPTEPWFHGQGMK